MRAYNMAMAQIFINCGFAILNSIKIAGTNTSIFGVDYGNHTGVFQQLTWLVNPIFTIPGINLGVTGIQALAGAMALATVIVLSTNIALVNAQGIAYAVFALIFWGSFVTAMAVISGIPFPGVEIFYLIYGMASALIFTIALIQMPTGGQKAHV